MLGVHLLLSVILLNSRGTLNKRMSKMKDGRLIVTISLILVLLFLTSCSDLLNVLIIPEGKVGEYFVGKVSYYDWTGRGGTMTLLDKTGDTITCEGKYSMIKNCTGCVGKEFHAKFVCSNRKTADFNFTTTSCTESYGTAVDDLGNKYEVYIGISDELMEKKLAAYKTGQ